MASTDVDLVRRVNDGDEAACHELVDSYGAYLYRVAFSLVGNASDAEDVLQETFAGAFRRLKEFEHRSSLKTWLTRILMRQAARCHRTRGRHVMRSLHTLSEPSRSRHAGEAPAAPESAPDARMDVAAALNTLTPDHREVIVLREMQGLSYDEIAEAIGAPRGTVESRLFRARQELKDRLKDYLP